jgi:site-specific DNA-methyltransferase (adenine-specific)
MIRLFNCDNLQFMKSVPDKFYELAIVDPPYGIGMDNQQVRTKPNRPNTYLRRGESQYEGGGWDNLRPSEEYFKQLSRVSKNQIIWGANYFCEFIPSGFGWIFWDKQMGENQFSSGEFAFQSIQIRSAMFSYPSMRVENTRIHPTEKPIALYKWLLKNYAKEGDKIFDSHSGSLSIAIACGEMGFDLDACELDGDYFKDSVARVQRHFTQSNAFMKTPEILVNP